MIAKRTYLRVPLAPMSPRSATVWLVQLSHIKTGNSGASKLKGNVLNKKIQLFAAALNQGCRKTAELGGHVVPVLLGDQNLTMDEVTTNHLAQSLIKHAFLVATSAGLVDNQNRLHQDLVVVGDVGGLTLQSVPENVFGFDNIHQAVRARIDREPTGPEVAAPAAASAEAASAAASTHGEVDHWGRPPWGSVWSGGRSQRPTASASCQCSGRCRCLDARPHATSGHEVPHRRATGGGL